LSDIFHLLLAEIDEPTGSFVPMWFGTVRETQIPLGSARASNRAAILTASPERV
jgi:hypothetical protein